MPDPAPETRAAAIIAGQLSLARTYLRDSEILAQHSSRNAANLLFLAAEAALLAVLTSEGIEAGRSTQHQLGAMADRLPVENPLKPMFRAVEVLTAFATTFRYVSPSGKIKEAPAPQKLEAWSAVVADIIARCATEFAIDLNSDPPHPPIRVAPIRSVRK